MPSYGRWSASPVTRTMTSAGHCLTPPAWLETTGAPNRKITSVAVVSEDMAKFEPPVLLMRCNTVWLLWRMVRELLKNQTITPATPLLGACPHPDDRDLSRHSHWSTHSSRRGPRTSCPWMDKPTMATPRTHLGDAVLTERHEPPGQAGPQRWSRRRLLGPGHRKATT